MDVPRHTGKERFSPPQQSNVLQNRNIFTDYNSYLSIGFNKNENTSHDWMPLVDEEKKEPLWEVVTIWAI